MPIFEMTTIQDASFESLCAAAFRERAAREGLHHLRRAKFPAGRPALPDLMALGDVEVAEQGSSGATVLVRPEPHVVVLVEVSRGNGEIAVAGVDRADVDRLVAVIVTELRDREDEPADRVPVTFWANAEHGPVSPRRRVAAPAWSEVEGNYAPGTRAALVPLMAATEPGPGGLLLWHGEPGTGKSHALRALIREWRGWCDAHFITDAEAFLGAQAGYLLGALLRSNRRRARLVIIEDAGELLAADARAVAGQAVSRLLNLSDGLLGAGLRMVVLVTTNEPLRRLHPAVARPGRCWAQVEFSALPAVDADAWLAPAPPIGRAATIAELFAVADGHPVAVRPSLGFAS